MIKVTVELVSAINPARSKILGIGYISNTWQTTKDSNGNRGDYSVRLSQKAPHTERTFRIGEIKDFPRKRLGGWDILFRALLATVGERNMPLKKSAE